MLSFHKRLIFPPPVLCKVLHNWVRQLTGLMILDASIGSYDGAQI